MIQQLTKNQTWLLTKLKNGDYTLLRDIKHLSRSNHSKMHRTSSGYLLKDTENNLQGCSFNLVKALLNKDLIKLSNADDKYEYYEVA